MRTTEEFGADFIIFPEIVRMAKAKGAGIIFCPSCTDDRHGFHRVRYTSHARAIENQVYVVTTGTVGSLPTVDFMRGNFGQAAVITPNDVPFPPSGVLVEGEINQHMIVTADLDLELLYQVRESGSVTTWRDRRTDLYPDWEIKKSSLYRYKMDQIETPWRLRSFNLVLFSDTLDESTCSASQEV